MLALIAAALPLLLAGAAPQDRWADRPHGPVYPVTAPAMNTSIRTRLVPQVEAPSAEEIARLIEQDIRVQPNFHPGVGPFPTAEGRWTRDPESLTPAERTGAVSLYLALVTEACLGLCGLGTEIVIEGPLARNLLFAEALSGLTGVKVSVSGDATGTSLGASMLFGGAVTNAPAQTVVALADPGFDTYASSWRSRID